MMLSKTIIIVCVLGQMIAGDEAVWAAESTAAKPRQLSITAKIPLAGDFIAFGFGSIWMMRGNHVVRIDPASSSVVDIPVEGAKGPNRGVAIGENAVWFPDTGSKAIYKIDPQTNKVLMRIGADLSDSEGSIGVGLNAVWVVTSTAKITSKDYNRELSRFDAATGELKTTMHLPGRGAAVIFAYGSVWITGYSSNELYRVDPASNQIVATIPLKERPRFLASGEGSIWVVNQSDGSVQRIDARTNELLATIEADAAGGGGDVAVGGGVVWVTSLEWPVIKIDPRTNALVGRFKAPRSENGMRDAIQFGAGSLWVSGGSLFRINPP